MQLRPSSLSKAIPTEILHLIIQESSHCNSTLRAFCLVSLGCLSIAAPLLNEHVQIATQDDLTRVLKRIVSFILPSSFSDFQGA